MQRIYQGTSKKIRETEKGKDMTHQAPPPENNDEPTQEELRLGRIIERAIKAYYDDGDADFMVQILEGKI